MRVTAGVRSWGRACAPGAGLLILFAAASPVTGQEGSPLAGVDVFGTRAFSAAEVLGEYGAELDSIAVAFSTGRVDDSAFQRYGRVVRGLRERGDFSYLDLSVVQYFDRDQPTSYITVDVVARADSARRMPFRAPPRDTVADPAGIMASFDAYLDRGMALLQQGRLTGPEPPCPVLHCAPGFHHESLEAESARLVEEAPAHVETAARVLHADADPGRRAAAAFLLGYATDTAAVAAALVEALSDPSSQVRNNALRVLIMMAGGEARLHVPVAPVLEALHFPATTDRNKAAYVLLGLAADAEHRDAILRGAGPVLLDMLELVQPNNREPALALLRLLSGEAWEASEVAAWRAWWRDARAERDETK